MKFMHFNRSCSYACLAHLMEEFETKIQDIDIANKMKLPHLFHYDQEQDCFYAGAMLQGKKWFDLFLQDYQLEYFEERTSKETFLSMLEENPKPLMFGIKTGHGKHAVVFQRFQENTLFIHNPRHEREEAQDIMKYSKSELFQGLDDMVVFGYIVPSKSSNDRKNQVLDSLHDFRTYQSKWRDYCRTPHTKAEILKKRDDLMAALLLDIPEMMRLIGKNDLADKIEQLKHQFVLSLQTKEPIILKNHIDQETLQEVFQEYESQLESQIE